MSVAKPTPGPWMALAPSDDFPRFYIQSAAPDVEQVGYAAIGEIYACLEDSDGEQAECEANARLVAAAPEMLSALRKTLSRCVDCGTCGPVACPECVTILALIDAVEGRAR